MWFIRDTRPVTWVLRCVRTTSWFMEPAITIRPISGTPGWAGPARTDLGWGLQMIGELGSASGLAPGNGWGPGAIPGGGPMAGAGGAPLITGRLAPIVMRFVHVGGQRKSIS